MPDQLPKLRVIFCRCEVEQNQLKFTLSMSSLEPLYLLRILAKKVLCVKKGHVVKHTMSADAKDLRMQQFITPIYWNLQFGG